MTHDFSAIATRRELFHLAGGMSLAGLGLPTTILHAQEASKAAPALDPFQRFPRMVHEYYVNKVRSVEQRAMASKAALSTKAEAETYITGVRERIAKTFAPMPAKKTPLNAKVTGILDRDGYTVEKVIFESRPKFYVTAHLYLPKNRSGRIPGVVGSCGHSENGKNAEAYQSFAQGLARLGTA